MPVRLPISTPADEGVDARGVLDFLDAVDAEPAIELHSLLLLTRGKLVAEGYWQPYRDDDRPLVYSVSKTFSATAVGLAIGEGLFGLDDRLVDLLPEDVPANVSDRVREITVHHLLSMSTGHDSDPLDTFIDRPCAEWARSYLSLVPAEPVGSRHVYDNGASWLLGELVRRHSGQTLLGYLRPRLLEPLGLDITWDTDELGREFGWSGAHVPTRGLAAMGELYRCDGVWQGRRLLPEGWAARLGHRHILTADDKPEWQLGYGYQVWMGREGFRLDGAFGQFAFVLPDHEAVIALTSAQSGTQRLVDLLWEHIVPALDGFDGDGTAGEAELDTRLAGLVLKAPEDSGLGSDWEGAGQVIPDATLADHFEEQDNLPDLYDAIGSRDVEGGGFTVSFGYYGTRSTVTVPGPGWHRGSLAVRGVDVPVAVAAGADDEGVLELRILFVESPHTLLLALQPDAPARMAWSVPPLHSHRLEDLRAH